MQTQHDHIVRQYDRELTRLTGEIAQMGELALAQLGRAIDALESRDVNAAQAVMSGDAAIDAMEHEVSHDVVRLLALRQPMARDLREILAALRIASAIERIGDYASNAAKRSIALAQMPVVPAARGLRGLALLASELVRDVLRAYREHDEALALTVRQRDAELDAMHTALFRELLSYMAEDARNITPSIHLLFIAKNIERVGDHATNIAENIWFVAHGEVPSGEREKRDDSSSAG